MARGVEVSAIWTQQGRSDPPGTVLYEEVKGGGSHEYAYEHAPETELSIRHEARELARKIRDGERRRRP